MNPNIAIAAPLITFVLLIMIKRPITFSTIISTAFTTLHTQVPAMIPVQQMSKWLSPFLLSIIPFFILMGEVMAAGGIPDRLLALVNVCVGQITGDLAHASVSASMLSDGISGPTIADVSPLGALEAPMMKEVGHEKDFSIAATMASSCQGLIIPLSRNIVLYPMVAGGVSVGSLFCADYTLGIMLGVFTMGMYYTISKKKHCPKGKELPFKEVPRVTKDTFFAVSAMVVIIGGVLASSFTATESATVTCIYCLFVEFFIYRELRSRDIPVMLRNTIKTPSMVHAFVTAAGAFDWVMTYLNVLTLATNLLPGVSDNKVVVLLLINLILLLLGCIMDLASLVLTMAPILLPVMTKLGMSLIQSGAMTMLNLGIGLCTPFVGTVLFTGCTARSTKTEKVSKAMLPSYIPMFITLLLVILIPALVAALPELIMK